MQLIVGLGNPGSRYATTRHNVGAMVVERAAAQWRFPLLHSLHGACKDAHMAGQAVVVAARLTWMNQTGPAIAALLWRLHLSPSALLIVHDDLDLSLGRLRIRRRGGAGGHRGLLSILESLGSDDFARLKIGIGRPPAGQEVTDYVLEPFASDEQPRLQEMLDRAVAALETLVGEGIDVAMNRFNIQGGGAS